MKIKSIRLTNTCALEDLEVEFPQQFSVVVGPKRLRQNDSAKRAGDALYGYTAFFMGHNTTMNDPDTPRCESG
jgi:hypothetical protein